MKTIEAQIPEPVLKQAEVLAQREHVPLEQIISLAVTQTVGIWSNESDSALRAKQVGRERFLDALTDALNTEPPDGDCVPVESERAD